MQSSSVRMRKITLLSDTTFTPLVVFGTSEQNPKACHNFGSYFPLFYITAANKTNLCRPEELSYLQDATSVSAAEQN